MSVKDYHPTEPVLDLEEYFRGELQAWGIFQARNGQVKRHFKVNIRANWQGNVCTLEELFEFNDGEEQQRTWTITKHDSHRYSGVAADVVGKAQGEAYGQALNWHYTLDLPVGDKHYQVKFDDWMYLVADDILINRAVVRKFGFKVAEVTIFFQKMS